MPLRFTRTKPPVAFICYSHRDRDWLDRLTPLFKELESTGQVELWHDQQCSVGEDWFNELTGKLYASRIAILLVSPNFLLSTFVEFEEIPYILEKQEAGGTLVLPIVLWGWDRISGPNSWLAARQPVLDYGKSLSDYADIREAFPVIKAKIQHALTKLQERRTELIVRAQKWSPDIVDLTRLPISGKELFGRREDISFLNAVWRNRHVNAVSLIAAGGHGKSAVINRWLLELEQRGWDEAERVFGWSFYSQGSQENRAFSAQSFIHHALRWFGDPAPEAGSDWDKGERLARLIGSRRAILVLDGLEPLQWRAGVKGKIKDPGLATLMEGLAASNKGLCVITSREAIADLNEYPQSCIQRSLDALSQGAGRALLRVRGVRGTNAQLEAISAAFGNHALAIALLAAWLTRGAPRDGRTHTDTATAIPDLPKLTEGRHPRRVLEAFAHALAGSPEIELLRIVSLFDQPCHLEWIYALLSAPPIDGITTLLSADRKAMAEQVLLALGRLQELQLVSPTNDAHVIDTHPLIREHFYDALREALAEGSRKAHSIMARHFDSKSHPDPTNIDEAMPLYLSAHHLALSGDPAGTYEYYKGKILQGDRYYSHYVLGAYGNDLAVLSHLFATQWSELSPELPRQFHAHVLRDAAVDLQALGQMALAAEAMEASYRRGIELNDWKEASFSASYLSELLVVLGRLDDAERFGLESEALGRRSGDKAAHVNSLSSAADALHQVGKLRQSRRLFKKGIAYQRALQNDVEWKRHFVLQGYHYCSLLFTLKQHRAVESWARGQIESNLSQSISLVTYALDHVSLGRALLASFQSDGKGSLTEARTYIDKAVDLARQCGDITFLPPGLLARAELLRLEGKFSEAKAVLDYLTKIAVRGAGMRLYLIDAEVEKAKVLIASGEGPESLVASVVSGLERKIDEMHYLKKQDEIRLLKRMCQRRFDRSAPRKLFWWRR